MKHAIGRSFLGLALAVLTSVALALPSVEEVRSELGKGNYAQAEKMMKQVVAARPDSARAHYVYAEILASNKRFDQALVEARRARELDPGLKFTSAEKFTALMQLLEREQASALRTDTGTGTGTGTAAASQAAPGIPAWGWGLGLGALAVIAFGALRSRRQSMAGGGFAAGAFGPASAAGPRPGTYGAGLGGYNNPGTYRRSAAQGAAPQPGQPGFGYGNPGYGPGRGSGMLGTGLAVAGGAAAGMLAERMLHGDKNDGSAAGGSGNPALDGLTPGAFDDASDASAQELARRDIDIGSGSDWERDDAPGPFADNDHGGDFGGDAGGDDGNW